MFLNIIFFILGFILISKGADIFINCTVNIGKKLNISELILGATIVSFATTLPELTVSTLAAFKGHTTMSLGNAVGSIICNTGLVLGLVAFISPFKVDKKMFFSKSILLLNAVWILIFLGSDNKISGIDSLVLLGLLVFYMYSNYKSVSNMPKNTSNDVSFSLSKTIVFFVIGLFMMILGSRVLVDNGVIIATFLGIPQGVISLTVIALGTSLPELVSSLTAVKKRCHAICVGNILGANILNIVSVIGISSIFNDIPVLSQSMNIDFPFMVLLLLILIIPTIKNNKLYKIQGALMVLVYFIYISVLYFMYL